MLGRFAAPSAGTLRRVLMDLDADVLDAAVGGWLRAHADNKIGKLGL